MRLVLAKPNGYFREMESKKRENRKGASKNLKPKGGNTHSPFKKTRGYTGSNKVNLPKFEDTIRLNKFLSNAGVCSRREADTIILSGAVAVNGKAVTELGVKVDPETDNVKYGGQSLSLVTKRYFLLNKPKDFVSNPYDLDHKRSVMSLVANACKETVYPVGQLDRHNTGLLLFTNDGDLEKKLIHPKVSVKKLYHVSLRKPMGEAQLMMLRNEGIKLDHYYYKPESVAFVQNDSSGKEVGIEIKSGKESMVKRVFEFFDLDIIKIDRVMYAGLTKRDLPRGNFRALTSQEVQNLKNL